MGFCKIFGITVGIAFVIVMNAVFIAAIVIGIIRQKACSDVSHLITWLFVFGGVGLGFSAYMIVHMLFCKHCNDKEYSSKISKPIAIYIIFSIFWSFIGITYDLGPSGSPECDQLVKLFIRITAATILSSVALAILSCCCATGCVLCMESDSEQPRILRVREKWIKVWEVY